LNKRYPELSNINPISKKIEAIMNNPNIYKLHEGEDLQYSFSTVKKATDWINKNKSSDCPLVLPENYVYVDYEDENEKKDPRYIPFKPDYTQFGKKGGTRKRKPKIRSKTIKRKKRKVHKRSCKHSGKRSCKHRDKRSDKQSR